MRQGNTWLVAVDQQARYSRLLYQGGCNPCVVRFLVYDMLLRLFGRSDQGTLYQHVYLHGTGGFWQLYFGAAAPAYWTLSMDLGAFFSGGFGVLILATIAVVTMLDGWQ